MAGKNTSIALGAPYTDFARKKVESGEFGSTSEVVREAMRRYISYDMKREALERALQEGLDSGPAEPFDFDEFLREMRANYKGKP
jgi:antitoxin ParD1/3/4